MTVRPLGTVLSPVAPPPPGILAAPTDQPVQATQQQVAPADQARFSGDEHGDLNGRRTDEVETERRRRTARPADTQPARYRQQLRIRSDTLSAVLEVVNAHTGSVVRRVPVDLRDAQAMTVDIVIGDHELDVTI